MFWNIFWRWWIQKHFEQWKCNGNECPPKRKFWRGWYLFRWIYFLKSISFILTVFIGLAITFFTALFTLTFQATHGFSSCSALVVLKQTLKVKKPDLSRTRIRHGIGIWSQGSSILLVSIFCLALGIAFIPLPNSLGWTGIISDHKYSCHLLL